MWRTNDALPEIAVSLSISESLLHSYVYELIKRDAMNSTM